MNGPLRLRQLPASYLAAAIWLAVFIAAVLTGERVRVNGLHDSWHVLPLEPLREHTLQSLWNLHTQPPLWNGLVAVAEWIDPLFTFYVLMAVSGAVLAWAVAELAAIAGASARAAVVLALFATLSGRLFGFAFGVNQELPVSALLAVVVLLAARHTVPWPIALAGLAVVLVRSIFHPLWFLLLMALWWWLHRRVVTWRPVVLTSLLSLALLGGLMVKNEVKFDMFALVSWYGMNMLRSVQGAVGQDRLDALVADGTISPVGGISTFLPYKYYAPLMPPCVAGNGPAVLVEPSKGVAVSPHNRQPRSNPNFNYYCFLQVYRQAGIDAAAIIKAEPVAWIKARVWATNNWFGVPPKLFGSPVTRSLLNASRVTLLLVPHPGLPDAWSESDLWVHDFPLSIMLMVLSVVVLWSGLRALWWRSGEAEPPGARRVALVMSALVVGWSMVIGIVAELGEQERFRLMTDPLVLAVGGAVVWTWWKRHCR